MHMVTTILTMGNIGHLGNSHMKDQMIRVHSVVNVKQVTPGVNIFYPFVQIVDGQDIQPNIVHSL